MTVRTFKAKTVLQTVFAAALASIHQPVLAQGQSAFQNTVLLEKKVELPSKEIAAKILRVSFPPGFKTPQHTHKGPGPRYVVKGQLKVIEGDKAKTYSAGEVFWESGQLMSVENISKEAAELIIFELGTSN